jgi:ABC-2 type transport system permease protein
MITKNRMNASALLSILIPVTTFISGGYAKIITDNQIIENFKYILPNHLAQTSLFNIIYNGSSGQTEFCIALMLVMTVLMLGIASLKGRRRLA